jgi:uncharacterized LabA/DUF88 family protein
MFDPREKVVLFIDGANLYATSRAIGIDIDYKRLLSEFRNTSYLLRAYYYTALVEDQEYSSIRPLIDWLDYNGYTVVTKPAKEFVDSQGRRKIKGNMDIELAIDAIEMTPFYDHLVLFSGATPGQESDGRLHPDHPNAHDLGRFAPAGRLFSRCIGSGQDGRARAG